MYEIYNNLEEKTIFKGNEREFIVFVEKIVIENEDFSYSVLGVSDAIEYIEVYCAELKLIEG